MGKTILLLVGLFLLILFISPSPLLASSINLSEENTSLLTSFDQEYRLKAELVIKAADDTKYYLRGVFYPLGTNKYCGYTKNDSNWYNGPYTSNQGWKNLPSVTVSSGSASIVISAKLDPDDKDCQKPGDYHFKVQRYTESGSSSFDDQNEKNIQVSVPTITPTSTPVIEEKPTKTPVPTFVSSTATITQSYKKTTPTKPIKFNTPTSVATSSSFTTLSPPGKLTGFTSSIAGASAENSVPKPVHLVLFSGLSMIFGSAYFGFKTKREGKTFS